MPFPIVVFGVNVLIDLATAVPLGLDFTPTPTFALPIPFAPTLVGLQLFAQGAALDAAGFASTQGLRFTICP